MTRLIAIFSALLTVLTVAPALSAKSAILVAHYGSSDDDTRAKTISLITQEVRQAFPEYEVREAYISPVVRRNLARRGVDTASPVDALLRLRADGYDSVYVQSTTLIDGNEMAEVRDAVARVAPFFSHISVGQSLMYSPSDCETVASILLREPCAKGEAVIYVGHGNMLPSTATYSHADYAADAECREMEEYLLQYRVFIECGFQRHQNIDAIAYPLSDGVHWVAYVSHDMVMEGFGVALPGLTAELVGSDKDGKLWIETHSEAAEDDLEDLAKEIRELSLSDEIVDRSNEVNKRYNEALTENPGIVELLESTHMLVQKKLAEYYSESVQEVIEEASEPKPAGKGKYYVVKKGDCLWDIAEKQLGDGMRWSSIYEANKALIGDDPNLLYVGIVIQLN